MQKIIEIIWINYPTATIEYTLPLNELYSSKKAVLVILSFLN